MGRCAPSDPSRRAWRAAIEPHRNVTQQEQIRLFGAKIFILNQVLRRSNETAYVLGRV
jgi:hypothetical protein